MTLICYQEKPFRRATLAIIERANEIIDAYEADGYTLTLRQLYYQFVSLDLIKNEEKSYKNLGNIITDARMAGLISWDAIEDRGRGIRPWLIQPDQHEVLRDLEYQFALDYWTPQNVYVEVWVEKEALSSVIERPCQRLRVPFMPCKGYLSASEAWRSGQRFEEALGEGKRCVVIHLGDHDPSGMDMTRDNGDRLDIFTGGGVEVHRIALNMDQVQQYRPPPNFLKVKADGKLSDTRAREYVRNYGEKSWELDALRPQVVDKLITDAIEALITDREAWEKTQADEAEQRKVLAKLHPHWWKVRRVLRRLS